MDIEDIRSYRDALYMPAAFGLASARYNAALESGMNRLDLRCKVLGIYRKERRDIAALKLGIIYRRPAGIPAELGKLSSDKAAEAQQLRTHVILHALIRGAVHQCDNYIAVRIDMSRGNIRRCLDKCGVGAGTACNAAGRKREQRKQI